MFLSFRTERFRRQPTTTIASFRGDLGFRVFKPRRSRTNPRYPGQKDRSRLQRADLRISNADERLVSYADAGFSYGDRGAGFEVSATLVHLTPRVSGGRGEVRLLQSLGDNSDSPLAKGASWRASS